MNDMTEMPQSENKVNPPQFDQLAAKAIELYRNQRNLTDRIWSYFGNYTAMMILVSVFSLSFGNKLITTRLDVIFWLIPFAAYAVFAATNHRTLALALHELHIVRGIAAATTRRTFGRDSKANSLHFHTLVIVIISAMFLVAWMRLVLI